MKTLQEIIIPQESVNDDEVVVLDLYFQNGEMVKKGDVVLEFETSKANVSLEVLEAGYIYYHCSEGDQVNVGSVVASVYDEKKNEEKPEINRRSKVEENDMPSQNDFAKTSSIIPVSETIFSKKAKLLLTQKGLSKTDFKGKDFVSVEDILLYCNQGDNSFDHTIEPITSKHNKGVNQNQNVHIEKISTQKKREIEYLSAVQSYGLNSSITVFVDMEKVINFVKNSLTIVKGSFLPIIIYELSRLLRKYPKLNAYFDDDTIVYYNEVNVGLAIDIDMGLKVLKMPNVDRLYVKQIETAIIDLSRKYHTNNTTVNDVSGVTFTVSDLSNEGVFTFVPLINKNNSSILAISSLDEGLKRINLTLSFDHRVTEGKYAADFLLELKTRIESYSQEISDEGNSNKAEERCYKCQRKLNDNLDGNVNFFKVIDSSGDDRILCSVCAEGY